MQDSIRKQFDTLVIRINPGDPVRITEINVVIVGEAKNDLDYQKIIQEGKRFIGQKLHHIDYIQFKNKLSNLSILKGYFDAKFQDSKLIVIPSRYQCIWNIELNSGQRYLVEKIQFVNSHIQEDYLRNISNIYSETYYSAIAIMELNNRLSSTNWFKSVLISSDHVCFQKKKLILNILLNPSSRNSFEFGVGYALDSGPRAKIIWKKPWVNGYGHSLEHNINLSITEQLIDLSYKIPSLLHPLERYYLLQGELVREVIQNIPFSLVTINMAFYWNNLNNWHRAINFYWHFNHCIKKNYEFAGKDIILIYPGISMGRIRKRGDIMPYWGDSQRYAINISNVFWKSHVNFISLQAQNIWIRTLLAKHRILIRGNLSWIESNKCFLPVSVPLKFFMNSHCGIRGYEYRSILSKSSNYVTSNQMQQDICAKCKLMTSTLEYQYHVFGNWWAAFFIDSGDIANTIKWRNFKSGGGIGIRWKLPMGPLKLDIAIPLIGKKINHRSVFFYINLGPEL